MSCALPSAIDRWPEIEAWLRARPFALFVDYDGTLTPIVARPELAILSDDQRRRLRAVAARHRLAVVTGRAMADIRRHVGLPVLSYAANHGFEIVGPDFAFDYDPNLRAAFERAAVQLRERVADVPGIVIESKGYSVALHFRLAPDACVGDLEQAIDDIVAAGEGLRKTTGKKLFEIRPAAAWHKGAAVGWLLERFGDPLPVVIGDDTTDEDAFAVVAARGGIAIVVGDPTWATAATHRVQNVDDVARILDAVAALP